MATVLSLKIVVENEIERCSLILNVQKMKLIKLCIRHNLFWSEKIGRKYAESSLFGTQRLLEKMKSGFHIYKEKVLIL